MAGILDTLSKIKIFKGEDGVVGVDIGSSAIKVVHIQKEGARVTLKNYGSLALGSYAGKSIGQAANLSKEKIAEALKDLLREAAISAGSAAMAIPLKETMISFIAMPDVPRKQLEKMVPIEARRYIPVPISEVALDFWVMPKRRDSVSVAEGGAAREGAKSVSDKTVEVLVAAIHTTSLSKYESIKSIVGLDVRTFEIESFSNIRALAGNEEGPVMIIDIGAAMTKLAMVEYGVLRSSHIVNKGSQDVTIALAKTFGVDVNRAEEIKRNPAILKNQNLVQRFSVVAGLPFSHIFAEANSVLVDYQTRHNKAVKKIILSGGGALLSGLPKLAEKSFNISVEVGDPFARFEAPAFLRETLKEIGPEFSVAAGAALALV